MFPAAIGTDGASYIYAVHLFWFIFPSDILGLSAPSARELLTKRSRGGGATQGLINNDRTFSSVSLVRALATI